ncbi:2OG-Fe(II) oxygenase [Pelagibius sp. Alg239-R121]|uniref:2OG-Fe(II) oxygenase n=1 Tax=Pelagibius sp. Alg239-R121 TaxID=2993448 RepID=UPI0024A755A7|nr:2OG-Fe(II) oxygenase [Pelagibius sp. Alg239-R121]
MTSSHQPPIPQTAAQQTDTHQSADSLPTLAERPLLAPGDRLGNFVLPGSDGFLWVFYEKTRGFRNLLFVFPEETAENTTCLNQLTEAYDTLQAARIDVFAIGRLQVEQASRLAQGLTVPFLLYADPQGKVSDELTGKSGFTKGQAFCLLLDENQRLLKTMAFGDIGARGLAADVVEFYQTRLPEALAPEPQRTAPVLIVPKVLDSADCEALIARWRHHNEEGFVTTRIDGVDTRRIDPGMKKRRDHQVLDTALDQSLTQIVGRRIAPELAKAFYFQRFRFDRFVITCYDAERGDYFRPHRDNTTPDTQARMFALTLNLNTEDYEGGGLRFPEYGPEGYRPRSGDAILFSCSLIHEALPVTSGRRFTLLSFLRDPALQEQIERQAKAKKT